MKGATTEEFLNYVRKLDFYELEDMCVFVRAYLEAYVGVKREDQEALKEAYMQYNIVAAEFMPVLLNYVEQIIELRKAYEDEHPEDREAVQRPN